MIVTIYDYEIIRSLTQMALKLHFPIDTSIEIPGLQVARHTYSIGIEMKMKNIMGIAIIIILMIHFTASGLVGFGGKVTTQNHFIKSTLHTDAIQKTAESGEQHNQDKSIFSNVTIISLVLAVIGLVAFRRNTIS